MSTPERLPDRVISEARRTRRHPRPTQFDYLHAQTLLDDLTAAVDRLGDRPVEVLDVWCGTTPYRDLFPEGSRYTGMDINQRYGSADVVSTEFLPFEDASYDVVISTQAFHYAPDPRAGLAEIRRVLRPGGSVILTVPCVWEYEPDVLEHRFTEQSLRSIFDDGWEDVRVVPNGGRAVTWAALTGRMLKLAENEAARRAPGALVRLPFALAYALVNLAGAAMHRLERRTAAMAGTVLPMNLLVQARRR